MGLHSDGLPAPLTILDVIWPDTDRQQRSGKQQERDLVLTDSSSRSTRAGSHDCVAR
jgi:hypothetical protein